MTVYDLGAKFDGLSAFCDGALSGTIIGSVLFQDTRQAENLNQAISRLRAGETALTQDQKARLSDFVNTRIAERTGANDPDTRVGPISADMWDRPLDEFFRALERGFPNETKRLAHTHAAIVGFFTSFDQYRSPTLPLVLAHAGIGQDRTRFPESAIEVDALTLPSVKFTPGETMTIGICHRVDKPSNGWLLFVRNPDLGGSRDRVEHPVWHQRPGDLIRWSQSPFPIPAGFIGTLPGFPANVGKLEGEFTAYLLIEEAGAMGVRRCVEQDVGIPWNPTSPSYEPTLHMISVGRRLFQKGNVGSKINYPPPTLLVRRYQVKDRRVQ